MAWWAAAPGKGKGPFSLAWSASYMAAHSSSLQLLHGFSSSMTGLGAITGLASSALQTWRRQHYRPGVISMTGLASSALQPWRH